MCYMAYVIQFVPGRVCVLGGFCVLYSLCYHSLCWGFSVCFMAYVIKFVPVCYMACVI